VKISPIKIIVPASLGGITGYYVGKKIVKNNNDKFVKEYTDDSTSTINRIT